MSLDFIEELKEAKGEFEIGGSKIVFIKAPAVKAERVKNEVLMRIRANLSSANKDSDVLGVVLVSIIDLLADAKLSEVRNFILDHSKLDDKSCKLISDSKEESEEKDALIYCKDTLLVKGLAFQMKPFFFQIRNILSTLTKSEKKE